MYKESYLHEPPLRLHDFTTVPHHYYEPRDTPLEADQQQLSPENKKNRPEWLARALKIGKKTLAISTAASAVVASSYLLNVFENMQTSAKAKPDITKIYDAVDTEYSNEAMIIFDGFNTFSADYFGRTLQDSIQQAYGGEGWSMGYNNAVLDSAKFGEVVETMQLNNPQVTEYDYLAQSAGSVLAAEHAVNTINNTTTPVKSVTLIAPPADFESVTQATKDEYGTAEKFADFPFIEYSDFFRFVLEMYFYEEDLTKDLPKTLDGIRKRFENGNVTSNLFLASQIKSVANADIPAQLLKIKNDPSKFQTVFNVVTIEGDTVTGETSAEKICAAVEEINQICNIFLIETPNGGHGGYYTKPGQVKYKELFAEIARINAPQLQAEWERYATYHEALRRLNTVGMR